MYFGVFNVFKKYTVYIHAKMENDVFFVHKLKSLSHWDFFHTNGSSYLSKFA